MTEGHFDGAGGIRMVDVGDKAITRREAHATGRMLVSERQAEVLKKNALAKGTGAPRPRSRASRGRRTALCWFRSVTRCRLNRWISR